MCAVPILEGHDQVSCSWIDALSSAAPDSRDPGFAERPLCRNAAQLSFFAEERARSLAGRVGALVQARGGEHHVASGWSFHGLVQVLPAARSAASASAA